MYRNSALAAYLRTCLRSHLGKTRHGITLLRRRLCPTKRRDASMRMVRRDSSMGKQRALAVNSPLTRFYHRQRHRRAREPSPRRGDVRAEWFSLDRPALTVSLPYPMIMGQHAMKGDATSASRA